MTGKYEVANTNLYVVFVNLGKVFDNVPGGVIGWDLKRKGVVDRKYFGR